MSAADINAAAAAEFEPLVAGELAVTGADGVGMKTKPSGKFACAGKAFTGWEIAAEDAEDDLRNELFADGDGAATCEPELHEGTILDFAREKGTTDERGLRHRITRARF